MKNRYQRLSKEEKKEAKKRYIAFSDRNKNYMSLLTRMLILGIIGLVYGIISSIFDAFILSVPVYCYIVDAVIVIFSVFLIVQKNQIQASTINKFLIDESKDEPVKEEKKETVKKVEEKKEEPKKEVKEEKKEVKTAKKAATKKATRKVEVTTEEPKPKKEKAEPKKVEVKEEEIEMPQPKAKKRKHVSKNSKAKKAAKKSK